MSLTGPASKDIAKAFEGNSYLRLLSRYEASELRFRMPMAVALLSVVFQEYPIWLRSAVKGTIYGEPTIHAFALMLLLAAALALPAATASFAIVLFWIVAATAILPDWTIMANHTYLAVWAIGAAIVFKDWWRSDIYSDYLRMTFGIVMIASFAQKILAGTYMDGSFLTYMAMAGSSTERSFSVICDLTSGTPCAALRYASIFILLWQLAVGILLLAGVTSTVFLIVEIGFLLAAGVYADEMNFQILNIALLCIVFRYGMPAWLLAICIGLLLVDVVTLSKIFEMVT